MTQFANDFFILLAESSDFKTIISIVTGIIGAKFIEQTKEFNNIFSLVKKTPENTSEALRKINLPTPTALAILLIFMLATPIIWDNFLNRSVLEKLITIFSLPFAFISLALVFVLSFSYSKSLIFKYIPAYFKDIRSLTFNKQKAELLNHEIRLKFWRKRRKKALSKYK